MHELTSEASELRIELVDFEGRAGYAKYSSFHVDNEINGYRLHVDGYEGTIGESPHSGFAGFHSGMKFTTKDKDNDEYVLLYSISVNW